MKVKSELTLATITLIQFNIGPTLLRTHSRPMLQIIKRIILIMIMITRGTVQGAQSIPFPSFRYGKKTGNNENLRRKWMLCKSSHVSNYK